MSARSLVMALSQTAAASLTAPLIALEGTGSTNTMSMSKPGSGAVDRTTSTRTDDEQLSDVSDSCATASTHAP